MDHSTRQQLRREEMLGQMDFSIKPDTPLEHYEAFQELKAEQQHVYGHLAHVYKMGGDNAAVDEIKAAKYADLAKGNPPPPQTGWHTSNIYNFASDYNEKRIMAIRFNLLTQFFFNQRILPKFFPFFGLLYGPAFFFDLSVVFKTTFSRNRTKDEEEYEKEFGYWALVYQRFKNVMQKDNRLSRMFNSGFWFILNVLTFSAIAALVILTSPISEYVIAFGSAVDLIHEIVLGAVDFYHHKSYLNSINKQIKDIDARLEALQDVNDETSKHERAQLEKEKLKLTIKANQVKTQIRDLAVERTIHFVKSAVILTGLTLSLFPPTFIAGIVLTSVGVLFSVGYWLYKKHQQQKQAFTSVPTMDASTQTEPEAIEEKDSVKNTYELTEVMKRTAAAEQSNVVAYEAPDFTSETSPLLASNDKQISTESLPSNDSTIKRPRNVASQLKLGFINNDKGKTIEDEADKALGIAPRMTTVSA